MRITLNLVLEQLSRHSCQNYIVSGGQLGFERLCLLPEKGEEIDPSRLYVGELSQALALRVQGTEFYCVCVRDRVRDSAETDELLSGLIVVNENVSQRKIYTELQDLFYTVSEWVNRMNRYAYEQRPLQDILELSEPVIGNFISVSDSALSLMCYTSHIPIDDPLSVKLLTNGFHPEETIAAFREQGLFELWDKAVGLIVNTDHKLTPYDLCSKVFKLHNTYYVHIVMTCNNKPLTPGLMDLFQMLVDILDIYVERDWRQHNYTRHDYDSLLIDLIEERAGDQSVVEERARHVCLPAEGPFQLCLIDFTSLDKLPIGRVGMELSELFPEAKVTTYQNRILLLIRGETDAAEEGVVPTQKLSDWLESYEAFCAVSCVFDTLSEIRQAYEQTQLVFKYSRYLPHPPFESSKLPGRILDYDSCFLIALLGESQISRATWRTTRYYRLLKKVNEHDVKHGSNNMQLLYTFLFCDCRASDASALLHMHRNNVLYRVGRIEEMLGVKLSEPAIKRGLMEAYPLLLLYGF